MILVWSFFNIFTSDTNSQLVDESLICIIHAEIDCDLSWTIFNLEMTFLLHGTLLRSITRRHVIQCQELPANWAVPLEFRLELHDSPQSVIHRWSSALRDEVMPLGFWLDVFTSFALHSIDVGMEELNLFHANLAKILRIATMMVHRYKPCLAPKIQHYLALTECLQCSCWINTH